VLSGSRYVSSYGLCARPPTWQGPKRPSLAAETMISPSLTTPPLIQVACTYVKAYAQLHGFKIRFESMWLDR
jgi:hypothetical protein